MVFALLFFAISISMVFPVIFIVNVLLVCFISGVFSFWCPEVFFSLCSVHEGYLFYFNVYKGFYYIIIPDLNRNMCGL